MSPPMVALGSRDLLVVSTVKPRMNPKNYHPWLHRFAIATACVALLPIVLGALVTTLKAGMAFADWPSSDGYGMFSYPWLKSAGDEFIEHGHRLAGIVIGLFSIGLTVLVWRQESRLWVRIVGSLVLVGVIAQGLLGGLRVLNNDPRLALVHGAFGACVFSLMAAMVLLTSRSWLNTNESKVDGDLSSLKPYAILTPIVLLTQYIMGGYVRHLNTGLDEHLGFAFVVLLFVVLTAAAAHRSGILWLRRPAWMLLVLTLIQIGFGAGAWVTRFGFASAGYVAVVDSTFQTVVRTVHMVLGMLVFMTSVIFSLRAFRLSLIQRVVDSSARPLPKTLPMAGGVA